jgi:cephalosporin hydroxylase
MSEQLSRPSLVLGIAAALLAALNVYQYVSRPDAPPAAGRTPGDALKVIDRFHQLFYENSQTWGENAWLGVQTWQNPNDVWVQQEIICEVKPDFIVECGTHAGGSACIWAMVLEQVHPPGRVITIDITDMPVKESGVQGLPIWKGRVDFLLGSSTDPKVVEEVTRRVKGKKVMVILDSLHTKDHVLAELHAYAPLVSVGSYLTVQDTNVNGHPVWPEHGPGPWEAVEAFLAGNRDFAVDRNRERLLFTMHPKGYLRRVR